MMKTGSMLVLTTVVSLAGISGAGCGIDESVHNAALKDRDEQKQKLAATQSDCQGKRCRGIDNRAHHGGRPS